MTFEPPLQRPVGIRQLPDAARELSGQFGPLVLLHSICKESKRTTEISDAGLILNTPYFPSPAEGGLWGKSLPDSRNPILPGFIVACPHPSSCRIFFRQGHLRPGLGWRLPALDSVSRLERVSGPDAWKAVAAASVAAVVVAAASVAAAAAGAFVAAGAAARERGCAFSALGRAVVAGSIAPEAFAVGGCCPAQVGKVAIVLADCLLDPDSCFCVQSCFLTERSMAGPGLRAERFVPGAKSSRAGYVFHPWSAERRPVA